MGRIREPMPAELPAAHEIPPSASATLPTVPKGTTMQRFLGVGLVGAFMMTALLWAGAEPKPDGAAQPIGPGIVPASGGAADAESTLRALQGSISDFGVFNNPVELPASEAVADAAKPTVVAVTPVRLGDGKMLEAGASVAWGATIARGIVRNMGPGPVEFRNLETQRTARVAERAFVVVDSRTGCSAVCEGEAFACCNLVAGKAACECRRERGDCQSGGEGATSCSIAAR